MSEFSFLVNYPFKHVDSVKRKKKALVLIHLSSS